jgi:hypothetical protein
MIDPSDSQGYIWDPRQNRNMAVLRIISAVDPSVLKITSVDWRALVKEACEAWEKSGVVAFTQTFGVLDSPDHVEGGVVLKAHESPYDAWAGFTNPDVKWRDKLEHGALVWIDPDTTKGSFVGITKEDFVRYIICHELGHVLGLAHRPDSIMAATGMEGKSTTPTTGDLDRLREIYT